MKNKLKWIAIGVTLCLILILGLLSVKVMHEYGWTVFIFAPFLIGFLPPFITNRKHEMTLSECFKAGFLTLGLACVGLLVFAIEGMVCILMASPILIIMTFLGAYVAYVAQDRKVLNRTNVILLLMVAAIGSMSFDSIQKPEGLIPVRTKVVVNAPIEAVWHNVVTFHTIAEPTDWIFKTGIAYPINATIEGKGEGAIRYCNFNTGSFVEPITKWQEPTLLQFDVLEQPIPMNEFNPFWEIHPPHLDGYFKSYKGQFKLTQLSEQQTELEGTTWYQVDITPEVYWKTWSNFVIHRIHQRVLNHIKQVTEAQ
ncbi:MAG: hypothetical protein AAF990_01750 [Bacteroidota bacterium]